MEKSNTDKTIKGISSQSAVTLVLGIVEILSFSIMSRLLTQQDFGYYAAITAITTIFSSLSEAGIGSAIIQRKDLGQKFIDNAFTLCFVCGGFIGLVVFIFARYLAVTFIDQSMTWPLRLMAITLFLNSLSSAFRSILHRKLQFLRIGFINLASLVITSIIAIVLANFGFGYYAIIAKALLTSVLSTILFAYYAHCSFHFGWCSPMITSIISFSGWLSIAGIFNRLAQQIDRLLMTNLLGVSALGAYNRPKEFISQLSSKLNSIFDSALFPVLSSLQDDPNAISRAYKKSLFGLNFFSSVLALSFIINSSLIIRTFFGENWLNLTLIFQLLSIVLLFNVDGRLEDCYLRSLGLTRSQFFFRILEFSLQVIGIYIGARWGLIGVSASVVIVQFVTVILKLFYINQKIGVTNLSVFLIILKGWLIFIYLYPICFGLHKLLPDNFSGNVLLLISYLLLLVVFMFVFPVFLGHQYREEVLNLIIKVISPKFRKRAKK